jgi:anti-sigma28 factor (negative regulator of flagellin synthesis)
MDIIEKELLSRKSEIQNSVDILFKANMKITDWDVPEPDDKEAAKILLDMIQERVEQIRADIEAGKYDNY